MNKRSPPIIPVRIRENIIRGEVASDDTPDDNNENSEGNIHDENRDGYDAHDVHHE